MLASCGKTQLQPPPTLHKYAMIVDWHSLDTTILYNRYTQDLGILEPKEAIKVDTASDLWFVDCSMLDRLQHLYYLKDGVKIQPSRFPKK